MSQFYTVTEVAELLKLKETTVREYLRNGELQGVRLARTWRVQEEDLKAFIQKHKK